jgi:hypothetical protein
MEPASAPWQRKRPVDRLTPEQRGALDEMGVRAEDFNRWVEAAKDEYRRLDPRSRRVIEIEEARERAAFRAGLRRSGSIDASPVRPGAYRTTGRAIGALALAALVGAAMWVLLGWVWTEAPDAALAGALVLGAGAAAWWCGR